jgi:hypothetical protein
LGESNEAATAGYEPELELGPLEAGFFAAAGLLAVEARFAVVVGRVEEDEDRPEAARLEAADRLDDDARFDDARFVDARFVDARLVLADVVREDAGVDVERLAVDERFEAVRRAAGLRALDRLAAGRLAADDDAPEPSSADTRLPRPSRSLRRPLSSWSTRSSSTSRMRFAAAARSPASSCAGPRSDCALSAVAANVRSMAERTASTASTAPADALSFLPALLFLEESFFAIAARS